jgi:hypothetical protein
MSKVLASADIIIHDTYIVYQFDWPAVIAVAAVGFALAVVVGWFLTRDRK